MAALFAAGGPLEIEIGPGRGAFLLERCLAAPTARLLGIEIRRKWATVVNDRLAKQGHGARARVFAEDAGLALGRLGPCASVTRVFLHFPDPWWKKRHHKRLVIRDLLLAEIARLLEDGGELFIQTDVPERADAYAALCRGVSEFEPFGDAADDAQLTQNPYEARSNRERRADADGLPVFRLRYRRRPRKEPLDRAP
ncbi:MAG: tRNA (guanine-N7)-methyltransferase [Myxococcales bacterium]|nr:tRNA (guanine-N7)-methyltransferase [Myxococcales bacterium]